MDEISWLIYNIVPFTVPYYTSYKNYYISDKIQINYLLIHKTMISAYMQDKFDRQALLDAVAKQTKVSAQEVLKMSSGLHGFGEYCPYQALASKIASEGDFNFPVVLNGILGLPKDCPQIVGQDDTGIEMFCTILEDTPAFILLFKQPLRIYEKSVNGIAITLGFDFRFSNGMLHSTPGFIVEEGQLKIIDEFVEGFGSQTSTYIKKLVNEGELIK